MHDLNHTFKVLLFKVLLLLGGPKTESMRSEASMDFMSFVSDNLCDMVVLGCDLCESSTGDGYKHINEKFKVPTGVCISCIRLCIL